MQHTYQIKLSLSSCSSVPAVSPAIWKEKYFFLTSAIEKYGLSATVWLTTDLSTLVGHIQAPSLLHTRQHLEIKVNGKISYSLA